MITIEAIDKMVPNQLYFSLKEACELKGLNYKTANNRRLLQPNNGKECIKVGGIRKFTRTVVLPWLLQSDAELEGK